jgi:exosortase
MPVRAWRGVSQPAFLLVALALVLASTKLVRLWSQDPIYSLGFLVAPWALWWVAWRPAGEAWAPLGLRVWTLGLTAWAAVAGWFTGVAAYALWSVVGALALLAMERGRFKRSVLPLVVLALAAPPPRFDLVMIRAQEWVAAASGAQLSWIGLPVTRDVWTLHTPSYSFFVAPVCTGVSGLLAAVALVGIVASHAAASPGRVAAALAVGGLGTLVLNVERIVVLVALTESQGTWFVEGAFHWAANLALSLVAVAAASPFLLRGRGVSS